ncbi:MAG TPA: alpha/beta hydrolase [Acidimicrobiia bacterium]|nr:alpha/beta hydrolase [Acidimicrobiia bacterium]
MSDDVYVHRGGADQGDTVVLVHGAGGDHTTWRFQTRWLAARGFRVLAPDLPGHGATAGSAVATIEEGARWLADLIAAEGMPPVTLAGNSMGALMAIETGATRPDLVDALVLVGCSPRMAVHPQLLDAADEDLDRAAALMAGWMMPTAFAGGHPEPGTWEHGAAHRLISRSGEGVLATDLKACHAYDATAAAGRIAIPTLIVSGSDDRMAARRGAEDLAGLISGAEVVRMEGTGHEPMIQAPRRFNSVIERFLASCGKASVR